MPKTHANQSVDQRTLRFGSPIKACATEPFQAYLLQHEVGSKYSKFDAPSIRFVRIALLAVTTDAFNSCEIRDNDHQNPSQMMLDLAKEERERRKRGRETLTHRSPSFRFTCVCVCPVCGHVLSSYLHEANRYNDANVTLMWTRAQPGLLPIRLTAMKTKRPNMRNTTN